MHTNIIRSFRDRHHLAFLKDRLKEFYMTHTMTSFVFSMIGIFIPLYLLKLGYSLFNVLAYFLVYYMSVFAFCIIAYALAKRIGIKHTLLVHIPLAIIYFLLLFSLDAAKIPIFLLAIIGGAEQGMYWMPMHSLFARCSSVKKMGSNMGKFTSLDTLAGIAAPLIGGIVIVLLSFKALLFFAMILMAVSAIPLFFSKEVKPKISFSMKKGWNLLKIFPRFLSSFTLQALSDIVKSLILPIFIFLMLQNPLSVGIIGSLVGVGAVCFSFMIGKFADKTDKIKLTKIASVLMAVTWIIAYFNSSILLFYVLTFSLGFFMIMFSIPLSAHAYIVAKKHHHADEFILLREAPFFIGRVLALLLAMLLIERLNTTFIMAGIYHMIFAFF